MGRIGCEAFRLRHPRLADKFVECEALRGLRTPEGVSAHEVIEVPSDLLVGAVVVAATMASLRVRFILST